MTNKPSANDARTSRQIPGVVPYDLFIVALTLLSIVNLGLYLFVSDQVILSTIWLVDALISGFFLIDFLRLFITAPNRYQYVTRDYGWADLLSIVPFPQFKILRVFRLVKIHHLINRAGGRQLLRSIRVNRASGAVYLVFFVIIVLLEFGSIAVISAESSNPEANIKTASDGMWWVYVTITTVGYGDLYPTTTAGRLWGTIVMLVGVGLFAVLTSYLANKFIPKPGEQTDGYVPGNVDQFTSIEQELRDVKKQLAELVEHVKPR